MCFLGWQVQKRFYPKQAEGFLPANAGWRVYLDNWICKYIRDVWDVRSRYADTPRTACFHFCAEVHTREYWNLVLKLRQWAMNVWRKVQQLHEAMRHIFDNDTSGFPGQFGMTVRYRCGQCNELSPVWIFWKSLEKFCLLMRAGNLILVRHGQIKFM